MYLVYILTRLVRDEVLSTVFIRESCLSFLGNRAAIINYVLSSQKTVYKKNHIRPYSSNNPDPTQVGSAYV